MKKLLWVSVLILLCWPLSLAAETAANEINFIEFQKIIDTQCTKCHTRARIEQAMAEGKAFRPIEERMGQHGANLSDRERDVMGVFWVENVPVAKNLTVVQDQDDPLGEYRSVVQSRCSGCHTLERIEQAMRENRSFEALAKMMLKRGAVLTEADHKVLGTFWGEPLR